MSGSVIGCTICGQNTWATGPCICSDCQARHNRVSSALDYIHNDLRDRMDSLAMAINAMAINKLTPVPVKKKPKASSSDDFLRNRIKRVLNDGLRQEPEEIGVLVDCLTKALIKQVEEWIHSNGDPVGHHLGLLAIEGD